MKSNKTSLKGGLHFSKNMHIYAIIVLFSIPILFVYGESAPDIDFMFYKGNQYLSLGEYEKAISIFEEILKTNPNHVPSLSSIGYSLSLQERYEEAIPYYERVLNIEPDNYPALQRMQDAILKTTSYRYGVIDGVLEVTVHDSKGGLIAFLKTTKILALDHKMTENLVESWPVSKIVNKNNQDFAVHQKEFIEVLDRTTILGFHQIPYSEKIDLPLVSTWHYQIPVEKGDIVSYVYSIFMPIR